MTDPTEEERDGPSVERDTESEIIITQPETDGQH
jgi:hypothetical protein